MALKRYPLPMEIPESSSGAAGLATFLSCIGASSPEERNFIHHLAEGWNAGAHDLIETAFMLSARCFGFGFIADDLANEPENLSEELKQAYDVLHGPSETWFAGFISSLFSFYSTHKEIEPTHVVAYLTTALDELQGDMNTTRAMLRTSPAKFKDDIREVLKKHPELFRETEAA